MDRRQGWRFVCGYGGRVGKGFAAQALRRGLGRPGLESPEIDPIWRAAGRPWKAYRVVTMDEGGPTWAGHLRHGHRQLPRGSRMTT